MGRGFKSLTAHDPIFAGVAELADALDLGSSVFGRVGSSPTTRIANHMLTFCRFSSVGRASVLQTGGRTFKSYNRHLYFAEVVQW